MAEVLCEAVECFFNSGGLRTICNKEEVRLDVEPTGSCRIFIPETLPVRCMDYAEEPALGPEDMAWPEASTIEVVSLSEMARRRKQGR